jgi:hypothetical protein
MPRTDDRARQAGMTGPPFEARRVDALAARLVECGALPPGA